MYNRTYTGKIELAVLDTAGTFCDGPGDLRHRWPKDDLRGCKAPVVPFYEALQQFGIECDRILRGRLSSAEQTAGREIRHEV